ncbi:MAG: tRNA (guanosine(46)-N7)-methyltransferase TrmB [Anaerovoracaceae bacterium]
MRQRRLKDLDERLERHKDLMVAEAKENKGKWRTVFGKTGPLFLELGCGKGQFVSKLAKDNPQNLYLAIEGQENVIVKAAEKIQNQGIENVLLISDYITDIKEYFAENELDGLYLNFSDPWPKARHAKRRLTYRGFLESYGVIIKEGGFIEFKTDNDDLFAFTLEEIEEVGYKIIHQTTDLHSSDFPSKEVRTEYEEKFSSRGKNINYVKVKIEEGKK